MDVEQTLSMEEAVEKLKQYMDTYDRQKGYKEYTTETFVNDVLFGLGISLNPDKYNYAGGFARFKQDLHSFLRTDNNTFDDGRSNDGLR